MKKLLALLLCAVMLLCVFASCGTPDGAPDIDYVKKKGKLVVGITDFAPMDYKVEGSDEWVGFDADMARKFGEYLGVEVEFVEINWKNKIAELDAKNIDCVWNGMTLTDEVVAAMSCSVPYCNNAQVVVVKAELADSIKSAEDCKELAFAVEKGSAGRNMAEENGFNYTEVDKQATALMEVASGTCDAAIIDSLMAGAMIGEGTSYANLVYTIALNSEEYGVGFRKDSKLAEEFNKFYEECKKNGTLQEIAEKYGVQEALIK